MPLFRRSDPDARALIAYMVARAREHGITPNRTKLVKLLYLVDVARVRSRREPLTGFEWVFFHFGPYAFELIDTLESMEGRELAVRPWRNNVLYVAAPGAPDGDEWPPTTKATVDHIVDRYAPLELNDLLDYVYFNTGPMINARRGERLDLSRARDDRDPDMYRALVAPAAPSDVEERLARWRSSTSQRLAATPRGEFWSDVDEDDLGEGVSGRLHVPEDTEL